MMISGIYRAAIPDVRAAAVLAAMGLTLLDAPREKHP